METEDRKATERAGATYPKRPPFYDNETGMAPLHRLAERRGVKAPVLLRMLVREEAERIGEPNSASKAMAQPEARTREAPEEKSKLWADLVALAEQAQEEDTTPMPPDLTAQLDRYVYGTPKR